MMKESNFTEEEKKSLEEELKHFEARIEKHRYFKYHKLCLSVVLFSKAQPFPLNAKQAESRH